MSAERKPAQDARFDSSLSMDSTNKFAVAKNVLPVLTPLVPPELSRIVELSQELMQSVTGTSTVPLKIGTGVQRSLTAMASVCRGCGAKGRLQAHHIKPYKAYPELRHVLSNGTNSLHPLPQKDRYLRMSELLEVTDSR